MQRAAVLLFDSFRRYCWGCGLLPAVSPTFYPHQVPDTIAAFAMRPTLQVDLLIIVALTDELDGVLAVSAGAAEPDWSMARDGLGFKVRQRSYVSHHGIPFQVAVARTPAMGGAATAATAARLLAELRPRFLAMCGVCAGRRDKTRLGDVIVADRLYEADAGKIVCSEDGEPELLRNLTTYNLDPRWKEQIEDERRRWAANVKLKRPVTGEERADGDLDASDATVHIGPLATVFNVTQDREIFSRMARIQRSVLGLEMEGAAMGLVAHVGSIPLLVAKAVQDFADEKKADRYREFACRISAEFVVNFFRWAIDQTTVFTSTPTCSERLVQSEEKLRRVARKLLDDSLPDSLHQLFPDASSSARTALTTLSRVERRVRRAIPMGEATETAQEDAGTITALAARKGRFLILAPPGSGKTHALWHAANTLLDRSGPIPIFIPGGRFATWANIQEYLSGYGLDPRSTVDDGRVVVFLDGWSEFGSGSPNVHRDALQGLTNAPVLATARHTAAHDARYETFDLEPLPDTSVASILAEAFPRQLALTAPFFELLRLPIALVLHLLVGGRATTRGNMIAQLHDRLRGRLPDTLTSAIAIAAARTALSSREQRPGVFESELRRVAEEYSLPNALDMARDLGVFGANLRQPRPVHDLYWDWLVGVGLVEDSEVLNALARLDLRDSLILAVESGAQLDSTTRDALRTKDVELATRIAIAPEPPELTNQIEAMLRDDNEAIRRRGVVAGLHCRNARVFREALRVRSEQVARRSWFDIAGSLDVTRLWDNRAELASWSQDHDISEMLDAIAERGGDQWVPWLQQVVASGRVPAQIAAATATGCSQSIPEWVVPLLPAVLQEAWLLRAATRRGTNVDLAR